MGFDQVEANDWLAVNQLPVAENKHTRRPYVVLFLHGLPLAVLETGGGALRRMGRCVKGAPNS